MLFLCNATFLGHSVRTSKNGNNYTIVNVCDDAGSTLNCMVDSKIVSAVSALERFKAYSFGYEYNPQYQSLKLVSVSPVKG